SLRRRSQTSYGRRRRPTQAHQVPQNPVSPSPLMTWEIDKTRTKLEFSVRHMLIHTVRGIFRDFEVELNIDPTHLPESSAKARISTKSVSTRDRLRDEYLVSDNFFNPRAFPFMEYRSTSVRLSGKKLSVSGLLKIRDKEHQLILS